MYNLSFLTKLNKQFLKKKDFLEILYVLKKAMIKDVPIDQNRTEINSRFYNDSFVNPEMDY